MKIKKMTERNEIVDAIRGLTNDRLLSILFADKEAHKKLLNNLILHATHYSITLF